MNDSLRYYLVLCDNNWAILEDDSIIILEIDDTSSDP